MLLEEHGSYLCSVGRILIISISAFPPVLGSNGRDFITNSRGSEPVFLLPFETANLFNYMSTFSLLARTDNFQFFW